MKLEVIVTGRETATRPAPLLLVHGAWLGAWCWQEHFAPAFAAAGYAVYALSLRGHGGSEGHERLRWLRIADYVADVATVAATLPVAPILVGHSMGGLVAQKYLERHPAPAAVLLASVPTAGATGAALRVLRHHPVQFAKINTRLSLYPVVETVALTREYLFSPSTPPELVAAVQPRLQDESYRAFLDMMTSLPRPKRRFPRCSPGTAVRSRSFLSGGRMTTTTTHPFPSPYRWFCPESDWRGWASTAGSPAGGSAAHIGARGFAAWFRLCRARPFRQLAGSRA